MGYWTVVQRGEWSNAAKLAGAGRGEPAARFPPRNGIAVQGA